LRLLKKKRNVNTNKKVRYVTDAASYNILYIYAFIFFLHVHVLQCFHGHEIYESIMRIRYYVHTNECEKHFAVLNENQSTLIDKRITSWSLTLNRAKRISEAQKVLKSFFVIIFSFFFKYFVHDVKFFDRFDKLCQA